MIRKEKEGRGLKTDGRREKGKEWDPEEDGSFYTDSFIIGDRFSDEQILTALTRCEGKSMKNADDAEEIGWALGDLINDDLVGDLKSYYLMDGDTLVYENEEF